MVLVLAVLAVNIVFGQELSGRVFDEATGKGLPKASVYIVDAHIGMHTDSGGYFAFTNPLPDEFSVRISYSTYETRMIRVKKGAVLEIGLLEHHLNLEDVIVSSPAGGLAKDNAFRIEHLKLKELNAIQSSSLAEAISNINGVQQASLGVGIAKPVIRGMQGIRLLTLLNGIRVENQQWGGDHGMAVTQLGVESVEVIKGPSSLLYGGDAFGGVLYLVHVPYAKQNTHEISASSVFETVNMGTTNTLSYKVAKGIFRFNIAGLYANNADYQLPSGMYAENTRFTNQGVKMAMGVSKKNWVSHLHYVYANNRVGIPGHTHDSIIDPTEFVVNEQSRSKTIPAQLTQNHIVSFENKFFIKKNELSIQLGNTWNNLSEYAEKHTIPELKMFLNSTVYNVKFTAHLSPQWRLISGYQGMTQLNRNDSKAEDQLLPDFNQYDNGLYSIAYYRKSAWNVQMGLRYDMRALNVSDQQFSKMYGSPNFSFGGTYAGKSSVYRVNISTGYRAPHLSELFSDGIHHGSLRYEIGDSELVSEYASQIDISYELSGEHLEFVINPFYNYIQNFIQLERMDTIIENTQVFEYKQASKVQLYGVDIGLHYHPHFAHWLHLESSYSYVRGEELSGNSLSLMPQARLNSFVKVNVGGKKKFSIDQITVQHQYFFEQNRVTSYETPSEEYHLVNLGLDFSYGTKHPLKFGAGVKNVLNETYINHLSRLKNIDMAHPGRSFYLKVEVTINGTMKMNRI